MEYNVDFFDGDIEDTYKAILDSSLLTAFMEDEYFDLMIGFKHLVKHVSGLERTSIGVALCEYGDNIRKEIKNTIKLEDKLMIIENMVKEVPLKFNLEDIHRKIREDFERKGVSDKYKYLKD